MARMFSEYHGNVLAHCRFHDMVFSISETKLSDLYVPVSCSIFVVRFLVFYLCWMLWHLFLLTVYDYIL